MIAYRCTQCVLVLCTSSGVTSSLPSEACSTLHPAQRWEVTKHIYSSIVIKCSFEVLVFTGVFPCNVALTPLQFGGICSDYIGSFSGWLLFLQR